MNTPFVAGRVDGAAPTAATASSGAIAYSSAVLSPCSPSAACARRAVRMAAATACWGATCSMESRSPPSAGLNCSRATCSLLRRQAAADTAIEDLESGFGSRIPIQDCDWRLVKNTGHPGSALQVILPLFAGPLPRRPVKNFLLAVLALAALLCAVLGINTARVARSAASMQVAPVAVTVDSAGAIGRLSAAVRLATISYEEGTRAPDSAACRALHEHLRTSFPLVHAAMQREVVDGLALLYTWPGTDTALAPVVLMGHLDVVPVVPGTESRWTHPPFSGEVADGFIWGRGTLDDKVSGLSLLEGAEGT